MLFDLLTWWLLLFVLGRTVAGVITSSLPFAPHAFSKPVALLLLTYASWLSTSLGLPHSYSLVLVLIALGSLWIVGLRTTPTRLSDGGSDEILFAAAFFFAAAVRSLAPEIFGAEKFMDFAFFNACLRTEVMPPEDPWFAGAPINYYYFGYLTFANLARITGIASEIAYHLSLATISAFLFTAIAAIGRRLTGSKALGLLGGALAALAGNLDGLIQLVEGSGILGFDYWHSSRIIPGTINEFPFFSLLHGDLHPHVANLGLFVTALGLAITLRDNSGNRLPPPTAIILIIITIAGVMLTNPWDLPAVLLVTGAALFLRARRHVGSVLSITTSILALISLIALAFLLTTPFQLHFKPPLRGIGWVEAKTTLRELAVIFGGIGAPLVAFLIPATARRLPAHGETRELILAIAGLLALVAALASGNMAAVLIAATLVGAIFVIFRHPDDHDETALLLAIPALVLVLGCEIVFLRDSYGVEFHRMNTVFKFYFNAWVLLTAAAPWFIIRAWHQLHGNTFDRCVLATAGTLLIASSFAYPTAALLQRFHTAAPSLDGLRFLEREHPADAAAINWLRQNTKGRPVVVEATGDAYSYFARVSSTTGLPTLLGWRNHEDLWRANDPSVAQRAKDLEDILGGSDLEQTQRLLHEHKVRYIFVGELERQTFNPEALAKFERHPEQFVPVFTSDISTVYEVQ